MPTKYGPQAKYKKEHCTTVALNLQDTSGLIEALEKAVAATGKTKSGYCMDALREKLVRDEFWERSMIKSPVHLKTYDDLMDRVDFDDPFWRFGRREK